MTIKERKPIELEIGKFCYMIPEGQDPKEHGGWVPALVIEHESGYYPMEGDPKTFKAPWVFGPTIEAARRTCDEMNERLGLTDIRVAAIIASSMRYCPPAARR